MNHRVTWLRPTQLQLKKVLRAISECYKCDSKNELISLLAHKLGISQDRAKGLFFLKSINSSIWILLNALAKNDISGFFPHPFSTLELDEIREIPLFAELINRNVESWPKTLPATNLFSDATGSGGICSLTPTEFAGHYNISCSVFTRNIDDNNILSLHFKVYLLSLGFTSKDIF
jgi:hypothetical protein